MTDRVARRAISAAVRVILAAAATSPAFAETPPALEMQPLSSIKTGGAEIAAHDPQTHRLFVTNAEAQTVTILNASNPSNLTPVGTIDVAALGSPTSVAVRNGLVAIAVGAPNKTDPGHVAFYRVNGTFLKALQVGSLPDMVTFSPDGKKLLVANEGEPEGYDPGQVDPEGSISIIPIPANLEQVKNLKVADIRTAHFRAFNGKEAGLRAEGIRIYGPNANAAKDFEPEYIAVSADSSKAYVTLQENNAIAVVDIPTARVTRIMPLGTKDYTTPPYTVATYEWLTNDLPVIGTTKAGQTLRLGGFSGLAFEGATKDGKLKFITTTDRGPNGEPDSLAQRPFLLPGYTPRLVRFTLDPANGKFKQTQQILLKDTDGSPLTGLPNMAIAGGTPESPHNDEVPIDLFGQKIALDPRGGDFEGVAVADDGSFWLPDEYRPALYHFNKFGRLLQRFIPIGAHAAAGLPVPAPGASGALGIEALPTAIAQRRQNRGMEAIALRDGKVYAFVQSPIRNPVTLSNGALTAMQNVRVIEFDPVTRATRQFIYIMDNPLGTGADSRADKIGDMTVVPGGGFLALERDDDAVPEDPVNTITKKVYAFDVADATDISSKDTTYDVNGTPKTLDQMTADELVAVGVTPIEKTLHVDLAEAGYAGVEKIEGLAVLGDGRLAVVNDNDFTVAQININYTNGTFTRASTYQPEPETLGIISVPGLDASDDDGAINIRNWPVRGLYEPDAIAAFTSKGQTYLVTANEGDARDWDGLEEEERIKDLTLDETVFPDRDTLQEDENLGRLNVTKTLGDTDGDGDYDALYTLGGRSFSIRTASGNLVFDSDADLERITAAADPAHFNASNDNNDFDDRSDNKGPEPEGLTLGTIKGRRYVFVGLERTGGIAAYDITNPASPIFAGYANNRNFEADVETPEAGDLGPEGLVFIPAEQSPNGKPLLVISNEVSGTVTTYSLE